MIIIKKNREVWMYFHYTNIEYYLRNIDYKLNNKN